MSTKLKIEKNFAQTPNELLNDNKISLKAKGLYGYLQSKPSKWDFSVRGISSQLKESTSSINSALKELEKYGYLKRVKYQTKLGHWKVNYIIYSIPCTKNQYKEIPCTKNPCKENPCKENPCKENPCKENHINKVKKNKVKKNKSNKDVSKEILSQISENSNSDSFTYQTEKKEEEKKSSAQKKEEEKFSITELKEKVANEISWKESIIEIYKELQSDFNKELLEIYLDQFFKKLIGDGVEEKTLKDFKKHFNSWLLIQFKSKTNGNDKSNNSEPKIGRQTLADIEANSKGW